MNRIFSIAVNTFRETIRDRIFFSLLGFAVLMLGFSLVLSALSVGESIKIVQDFGLGALSIFGTLIAVFVGVGMLYKELDKRTIFVILSKPVSRMEFLLGKYAGLTLTLAVQVGVMTVAVFVLSFSVNHEIPWHLFKAIVPIMVELELVLAVAMFFSSFSTPFLSGFFTLAFFVIGHVSKDLKQLADTTDNLILKFACDGIYYILPNMENFNFKTQVVHQLPISLQSLWLSILYGFIYSILLFALAVLIFNRRDMK